MALRRTGYLDAGTLGGVTESGTEPPHMAHRRRLLPDGDRVIINRRQCFGFFTRL
jgi:hypothetical protein